MKLRAGLFLLGLAACRAASALGQTAGASSPPANPALPDLTFSLLRLAGALALVLAAFLGGAWLFRNWQRLVAQRGQAPKLNVLEVKSLGQRHALYVVGYEQQRLLLAASPGGVTLVAHLPAAAASAAGPAAPASFVEALKAVRRRS
jgi:flagellar biogenesis protein FliO